MIFKKLRLTLFVIFIVVLVIAVLEIQKPHIGKRETSGNKAPEFRNIAAWINSEPLTLEELRGKVVLVDFWTYSCINCIRTLPYLTSWDEKYRDDGLVIIGMHSPEFFFEEKYENVVKAVEEHGINYPVAQDNDFATWNAYGNRYWPHKYLIDIDGNIRYDHIGEVGYEETEKIIQQLLGERKEVMEETDNVGEVLSDPEEAVDVDFLKIRTPEIYLGYGFTRGNFGNMEGIQAEKTIDYKIPEEKIENYVYFEGTWKNNVDNMELISGEGTIVLTYGAKALNIVAGSEKGSKLSVLLDGMPLKENTLGSDAFLEDSESITHIQEGRLYNPILLEEYGVYAVEFYVQGEGFKIYTFTFG